LQLVPLENDEYSHHGGCLMAVYIVTGVMGSGKTLAMVGRCRDYIEQGKPVVTNIALNLAKLVRRPPTAPVYIVPDRPTAADLLWVGSAHETGREELNGALVLDEAGAWLNSRQWADKGRQDFIDWMLHARKRGWDVYLVVQSIGMLDKQVREGLGEYHVICRRLDRLRIPVFGRLIELLSFGFLSGKMPKVHMASVRYGLGPSGMAADTWTYRGRELYEAYQTVQIMGHESPGVFALLDYRKPADIRAGRGRLASFVAWVRGEWSPPVPRPVRPQPAYVVRAMSAAAAMSPDMRLAFLSSVYRVNGGAATLH
jgi:hypothetical protein